VVVAVVVVAAVIVFVIWYKRKKKQGNQYDAVQLLPIAEQRAHPSREMSPRVKLVGASTSPLLFAGKDD